MIPIKLASRREMTEILNLLKEYTKKLRDVCEKKVNALYRIYTLGFVSVVAVLFVLWLTFLNKANVIEPASTQSLVYLFAPLVGGFFGYVGFRFAVFQLLPKPSFDARQLYRTVERLVKTASQYSDHAQQRLSDKFLFDLRLAEAEAVLQMYQEIFRMKVVSEAAPAPLVTQKKFSDVSDLRA